MLVCPLRKTASLLAAFRRGTLLEICLQTQDIATSLKVLGLISIPRLVGIGKEILKRRDLMSIPLLGLQVRDLLLQSSYSNL
jgi:hypothetical protein